MKNRKKPKKYKSLYETFIFTMLFCAVYLGCVIGLIPDYFTKTMLSLVIIPFLMAILKRQFEKMDILSHMFIDMMISKGKRNPRHSTVLWVESPDTLIKSTIEISNVGISPISWMKMCVNPSDQPQNDLWFSLGYPLKVGETVQIGLPIEREIIDKVYYIISYEGVDMAFTFEGVKYEMNHSIVFSDIKKTIENYNPNKSKRQKTLLRKICV